MTPTDLRDRGITRRCALLGVGGVGAAAVLAACSSGSTGSDGAAATSAAPTTPASTTAGSSAAAPTTAASSPAAGGAVVAALADVPVGGTATGQVGGETVLLSQPEAGTVEAFSTVCPHQGGQVGPDGGKFLCSLHKSEFALDGTVTKGPAREDLTPIAVAVSGTDIVKA